MERKTPFFLLAVLLSGLVLILFIHACAQDDDTCNSCGEDRVACNICMEEPSKCKCCIKELREINRTIANLTADNSFTETDFRSLLANKHIQNLFRDTEGEIDTTRIYHYVSQKLSTRNQLDTMWSPNAGSQDMSNFNIHVFIENSGSMDGYVKGVTRFETAVYNLLADFKISNFCDSLNLYFINKNIPYKMLNILPDDIEDFIEKLEPSLFRKYGGDRSTTDLKDVVEKVIQKIDSRNAAILISDFVFSPGPRARSSPQDYWVNQSIGLKITFTEKLKKQDLGVIVLHMNSNFKGKYYRMIPPPVKLDCERPYYIWIIGTKDHIMRIVSEGIIENLKDGYKHKSILLPASSKRLPFKLLANPREGDFSLEGLSCGKILGAKASSRGKILFSMWVDLSALPFPKEVLANPKNWGISNPEYVLTIDTTGQEKNPYTHTFKLTTNLEKNHSVQEEILRMQFAPTFPEWVKDVTSTDDTNIESNTDQQSKTFGFEYIFSGMYDAFYPQNKDNAFGIIEIFISPQQ